MPIEVTLEGEGVSFHCDEQQTVLAALERLRRRGIPVGCRNGGCGLCRIQVISGEYTSGKISRACVSVEEEAAGITLACRVIPVTDLRIRTAPARQRARADRNSAAMDSHTSVGSQHYNCKGVD